MSQTPLALWAKSLCGANHCPGPEGCFYSSRSITQFKALGPPGRSKAVQSHVGSTPCCRSSSVPLPWGPPGLRGVPPQAVTNLPALGGDIPAHLQTAPLPEPIRTAGARQDPSAVTLPRKKHFEQPTCCLQKIHVPCVGTRAARGPFVEE